MGNRALGTGKPSFFHLLTVLIVLSGLFSQLITAHPLHETADSSSANHGIQNDLGQAGDGLKVESEPHSDHHVKVHKVEAVIEAPPKLQEDEAEWKLQLEQSKQGLSATSAKKSALQYHPNKGHNSLGEDHHHHLSNKHGNAEQKSVVNAHHQQHHDSAIKVSAVFPVDPDELETKLHTEGHRQQHLNGGAVDGNDDDQQDGSYLTRRKRHSNLMAEADSIQWVDDDEGKEFPEDLFHYYVKGGEGDHYGPETAPDPVNRDPAESEWFLSELRARDERDEGRAGAVGSSSLQKDAQDDFPAAQTLNYIAHLDSDIPVHIATRVNRPASTVRQQAVAQQDGSDWSASLKKFNEAELEAAIAPSLADILAREQTVNVTAAMINKMPKADKGTHPPMFNAQQTMVFSVMAAFLSFMAGMALYVCRPSHKRRKERAAAVKPLYDEPEPAEQGEIAVEHLEALLE